MTILLKSSLVYFRWRFIFSLPSMRRILPKILKDPINRLRQFFPSADSIKKFISKDLLDLISPSTPSTADSNSGPYKYESPLPDISLLPNIILDE